MMRRWKAWAAILGAVLFASSREDDPTSINAPLHTSRNITIASHETGVRHGRRAESYYANKTDVTAEDDVDTVIWTKSSTWSPREGCRVPRVLLVLYGQMRTFAITHEFLSTMVRQASDDCYLVVAVTDEEVCQLDPRNPGQCLFHGWTNGGQVAFGNGASGGKDGGDIKFANHVIEETLPSFGGRVVATVYQTDLANTPRGVSGYHEKLNLWGVRMLEAVKVVQESFASSGLPLDEDGTVVIRTRFDILPQTYPVFPWNATEADDDGGGIKGLFRDPGSKPIIYTSDWLDCQSDIFAYSSLRGMLTVMHKTFFNKTPCGEGRGHVVMDDDWNLCRRDLLRTNLAVTPPDGGLRPITVGRERRRLYCECWPELEERSDGFEDVCYARWKRKLPDSVDLPGHQFMYSTRTTFTCPLGSTEPTDENHCDFQDFWGPAGHFKYKRGTTDQVAFGHTNNVWLPKSEEYARTMGQSSGAVE